MVRKIPRGKGYDKAATLSHLRKMVKGGIYVTEYVKQVGLKLDPFMMAASAYDDGTYVNHWLIAGDPKIIFAVCEQCQEVYWPSKKGTRFCSSYCGNLYRKDQEYFGGNRNLTVGLKEGVCQLCERAVVTGLSSHHIYGKQNDEGNEFLLALCKGCHAIVSDLALKKWCGDTKALAKLIWLAYTQRNGAELIVARKKENLGVVWEVSCHPAPYLPS